MPKKSLGLFQYNQWYALSTGTGKSKQTLTKPYYIRLTEMALFHDVKDFRLFYRTYVNGRIRTALDELKKLPRGWRKRDERNKWLYCLLAMRQMRKDLETFELHGKAKTDLDLQISNIQNGV